MEAQKTGPLFRWHPTSLMVCECCRSRFAPVAMTPAQILARIDALLKTEVPHVFKTTDGGATWSRIDQTLPDMPVHSIVVHPSQPNTLYIGTDLGVFVTIDGGGTWMREN